MFNNTEDQLTENINNETKNSTKIPLDFEQYQKELLNTLYREGDIEELEKISHYHSSKEIAGAIPGFKKFLSSEKPLNKCYKGDFDNLFIHIFPFIFTSCKEFFIGKKGNSWMNSSNNIDEYDLNELDLSGVTILNGPNNLSRKQLITEIRNAIEHSHYITGPKGLYINNPKNSDPKIHAYDFEAIVNYDFLLSFVGTAPHIKNKSFFSYIEIGDDESITPDTYDNFKNRIQFKKCVFKKNVVDEDVYKEFNPTEKEDDLIHSFFGDKKISAANLNYVAHTLVQPLELIMHIVFFTLISQYQNKEFDLHNLSNDIFENIFIKVDFEELLNGYIGDDGYKKVILENFFDFIRTKRQKNNNQPLLLHVKGCIDYLNKYLSSRGFTYDKQNELFKKGEFVINNQEILMPLSMLGNLYLELKKCIELLPNRLRLKFIESVYANGLIPMDSGTVPGMNEEGVKDPNDKFTNREHVRNALVHNHYMMLPGIDKIILRDGYNKKNDSWNREKVINLPELFKETYNEMNVNFQSNY